MAKLSTWMSSRIRRCFGRSRKIPATPPPTPPPHRRRTFAIGTAAVGTGLALGLDIPFGGPTVARAADGSSEVNAWVVVRPDDTVVIRIARSEMGQGTLTGLAQLVAEELECD